MSIASVQEFLTAVSSDLSLQEELAMAMNAENDSEAVTALAQSKGYDFTADELSQEIASRQAAMPDDSELTDDELEAVAGGGTAAAGKLIKITVKVSIQVSPSIPKPKW
jgi:predicted ribosomally synthesized peptide with nif11-like leader